MITSMFINLSEKMIGKSEQGDRMTGIGRGIDHFDGLLEKSVELCMGTHELGINWISILAECPELFSNGSFTVNMLSNEELGRDRQLGCLNSFALFVHCQRLSMHFFDKSMIYGDLYYSIQIANISQFTPLNGVYKSVHPYSMGHFKMRISLTVF